MAEVEAEAAAAPEDASVDLDRQKHMARAKRFGAPFVEPKAENGGRHGGRSGGSRAQRPAHSDFTVGVDLFSEEEIARRKQRAERFHTQGQGLDYQPIQIDAAEAVDEERKKQRAQRFGTQYKPPDRTGLSDADLLEERAEADGEQMRRPQAIYLYGVDFLSTSDCLRYFRDFGAQTVEWLNDSACNVVFGDATSASRAVVALGQPLPPEESAPDQPGLDPSDVRNLPYLWHRGRPFEKEGRSFTLLMRIATLTDVKKTTEGQRPQTRRLWNLPVAQAERRAQQQKRRLEHQQPSQQQQQQQTDGDETMRDGRQRGERGGARLRRRKRRRQGLGEIEMASAEEGDEEGDEAMAGDEDSALAQDDIQGDAPVADLRELLAKRKEHSTLFSSQAAGARAAPLVAVNGTEDEGKPDMQDQ